MKKDTSRLSNSTLISLPKFSQFHCRCSKWAQPISLTSPVYASRLQAQEQPQFTSRAFASSRLPSPKHSQVGFRLLSTSTTGTDACTRPCLLVNSKRLRHTSRASSGSLLRHQDRLILAPSI